MEGPSRYQDHQQFAGGDGAMGDGGAAEHWSQQSHRELRQQQKMRRQQYGGGSAHHPSAYTPRGGGDFPVGGGAAPAHDADDYEAMASSARQKAADSPADGRDDDADENTPIIGKKYETDFLSRAVTRLPLVFAILSTAVLVGLAVPLLVTDVNIVADLDGFVPSSSERYKDALFIEDTVAEWRDIVDSRVVANWSLNYATRGRLSGRITAIFEVDSARALAHWDTLSTKERLSYGGSLDAYKSAIAAPTMTHVARTIGEVQSVPTYNYASCWGVDRTDPTQFCSPINSMAQYYFPGDAFKGVTGNTRFSYSGYSRDGSYRMQGTQQQISDAIGLNQRLPWYVDEAYERTKTARLTRMVIPFGNPVITTKGTIDIPPNTATVIAMSVKEAIERVQHPFINVYVGGFRIFDGEVTRAVRDDIKWVLLSCIFVAVATRIHMHSFFLALCCVLQTLTVFAGALFLYTAFTGEKDLPLLAVILYYVEMLMALAGQMVAFDVFKWSGRLGDRAVVVLTVAQRVSLVYRHAVAAITMVSIIIFAIFVVGSAASTIPVVSNFSNMMLIMTALNWLSMIFYFPACIVVHHYYFSHRRRNLQKQRELKLGGTQRTRIAAQISLHAAMEQLYLRYNMPTHVDLCVLADNNLATELAYRKDRISMKARLNLKPHFRRAGRRKANMIPAGATDPNHHHWDDGQQHNANGNGNGEGYSDEEEMEANAFNNVDARGFVVQRDAFTVPAESVVRITRANCETLGRQDPSLLVQLSSAIRNVDTASMEETKAFRDACGVSCAISSPAGSPQPQQQLQQRRSEFFSQATPEEDEGAAVVENSPAALAATKLLDVTRMLIHHIEGYGWSMTIPVPAMAFLANKAIREAAPPSASMHSRIITWFNSHFAKRNRKYCWGTLGPHKEDPESRAERIRKLSTKKEGPNRIERFLGGPYLRTIVGTPQSYVFSVMLLVFLIVAVVLCGFLRVASTVPTFLPRSSELLTFNTLLTQFGDSRPTCDYCSPYFTASSSLQLSEVATCASQLGYKTPYAAPNMCGSCTGDLSCRGCDDVTRASSIDSCNQCLPQGDARRDKCSLTRCAPINVGSPQFSGCRPCAVGSGGPSCTSCACGAVPSGGGTCNAYTGACDCLQSRAYGYWSGSACRSCDYGFTGGQCNLECSIGDSCGCDPLTRKCTSCPTGKIRPSTGTDCLYQDPSFCDPSKGTLRTVGGVTSCACNDGYAGIACKYAAACNGRGTIYTAAEVHASIANKCICNGNFYGPKCEFCRCYNGGSCNDDGTCKCVGSWKGRDCSECSVDCPKGGFCPVQWSPYHYDYYTCVGLFCTMADLANGPTSDLCLQCENRTKIGCNATAMTCTTDTYAPVSTRPRATCLCRGYWRGDDCTTCRPPYTNLFCNADGDAVGCDMQGPDVNGRYKVIDRCGVCGGDGICTGCDGQPGGARVDRCGVCGGNNSCPAFLQGAETVTFLLIMSGDHPMTAAEFTWYAKAVTDVRIAGAPVTHLDSTSPVEAFVRAESTEGAMRFTSTTLQELEAYVTQNQVADRIRFGYDANGKADRVLWSVAEYRAYMFDKDSETWWLKSRYQRFSDAANTVIARAPAGFIADWYVESAAYTALGTRDAIMWDTIYIIALASVITLGLLGVFVCSVKLVIAGSCVLATAVVCCFGVVRVLGLTLGPVEMIMVLFVMAFISSCVVYMADGYMEELHAVHSHLMAFATTRRQNVKGMLRRTGVPVSLACIVLFASSMLLLGASIDVINNVGKIMAICSVLTMLFCMVGYPALLSLFGPHKIRRNKVWMAIVFLLAAIIAVVVGIALYYIKDHFIVQ